MAVVVGMIHLVARKLCIWLQILVAHVITRALRVIHARHAITPVVPAVPMRFILVIHMVGGTDSLNKLAPVKRVLVSI